jgi:hypothetical protein
MGFNTNTTRQNGDSKPFNISLFSWYYIKQIMNVFIRAMVRIFSFGERWNVPFNSAVASLNGTFHLSPHENFLTIALINIHYLYNILAHQIILNKIT